MQIGAATFRAAILSLATLLPAGAYAEDERNGFDTEHIFGFMIGTDTGNLGEREFQSENTGRLGRNGGSYRATSHQMELEFVPVENFRIEVGGAFAVHDVQNVPGFDDKRQLTWQGLSLDLRYRFLNRANAPFGMTVAVESHTDRIDETTAARVRDFGSEFILAFDRELMPNFLIGALNFTYQPEWTRVLSSGAAEQESTVGASVGLMAKVHPAVLLGGEARYLRKYDGIGLNTLEGQAFFIGPVAYFQLSERSRLTLAWSTQAWGRPAGTTAALDLVNFERHQARLVFGVNF
jgi:hypothetical protein